MVDRDGEKMLAHFGFGDVIISGLRKVENGEDKEACGLVLSNMDESEEGQILLVFETLKSIEALISSLERVRDIIVKDAYRKGNYGN